MNLNKILHVATDAFKQNFTNLCQNAGNMLDKFDDKSFELMSKALIDAAHSAGQAGLEQFLKQNDTVCPQIIENNIIYRHKGYCDNQLLTLFGTISISRAMYYDETNGGDYYFPLDKALKLKKHDFATLETREMILFATSSCVPEETEELLKKCSLCRPSRTAIQNIINKDGATIEELRDVIAANVFEQHPLPEKTQALVVSVDGVNVLLREPGEKKGRKRERPHSNQPPSSLSPTSYHNAMVGAVSFYGIDSENNPERLSSVYSARMPQEKATDFKHDFEQMVTAFEQKCSSSTKQIAKILLTDGHLMIKGFAKDSAILAPYEKLLDFYHATVYLSKAADAVYGEKTDVSKFWYLKWYNALKTDAFTPTAILRSLKGFQKRLKLSAERAHELKTEITFFKKNKHLMRYSEFINRSLPIGSGPIEAAAKTIVKQRMCRSGMRWSRTKGQYVLSIRTFVKSGLWNQAWNQYKELNSTLLDLIKIIIE